MGCGEAADLTDKDEFYIKAWIDRHKICEMKHKKADIQSYPMSPFSYRSNGISPVLPPTPLYDNIRYSRKDSMPPLLLKSPIQGRRISMTNNQNLPVNPNQISSFAHSVPQPERSSTIVQPHGYVDIHPLLRPLPPNSEHDKYVDALLAREQKDYDFLKNSFTGVGYNDVLTEQPLDGFYPSFHDVSKKIENDESQRRDSIALDNSIFLPATTLEQLLSAGTSSTAWQMPSQNVKPPLTQPQYQYPDYSAFDMLTHSQTTLNNQFRSALKPLPHQELYSPHASNPSYLSGTNPISRQKTNIGLNINTKLATQLSPRYRYIMPLVNPGNPPLETSYPQIAQPGVLVVEPLATAVSKKFDVLNSGLFHELSTGAARPSEIVHNANVKMELRSTDEVTEAIKEEYEQVQTLDLGYQETGTKSMEVKNEGFQVASEVKIEDDQTKKQPRKCPHDKRKSKCWQCGGKGVCVHRVSKYSCVRCVGTGICPTHLVEKRNCIPCKGSNVCIHDKRTDKCKPCLEIRRSKKAQNSKK